MAQTWGLSDRGDHDEQVGEVAVLVGGGDDDSDNGDGDEANRRYGLSDEVKDGMVELRLDEELPVPPQGGRTSKLSEEDFLHHLQQAQGRARLKH